MSSKPFKSQLKQAQQSSATKNYDDVIEICDEILEKDDSFERAIVLKAIASQRSEKYEESLAVVDPFLQTHPDSYMALRARVMANLALNHSEKVYQDTMHAIYSLTLEAEKVQSENLTEAEVMRELDRLKTQALDVYKPLRSRIRKNIPDLFERLIELQLDLPDDLVTEPNVEHRQAIHNFLKSIRPTVLWNHVLGQLISLRSKTLNKKLKQITTRQKTTVGFTAEKALEERSAAIEESKSEGLLTLHISTEDDDVARRASEADLLYLSNNQLNDYAQYLVFKKFKVSSLAKEGSAKTPEIQAFLRVRNLQPKVQDLADTMASFDPSKPLAYESAWDYDGVDPEAVVREIQEESKKVRSDEKKAKHKKTQEKRKNSKKTGFKESSGDTSEDDSKDTNNDSDQNSHVVKNERPPSETSSAASVETSEDLGEPIETTPKSKYSQFLRKFSDAPLASVFRYFLPSNESPSVKSKSIVAYKDYSILGWLLVAKASLSANQYEEAIDASRAGSLAIDRRIRIYDMKHLAKRKTVFYLVLAQSYAEYQRPKNWELSSKNYNYVLGEAEGMTATDDAQEKYEAISGKGTLLGLMGENEMAAELLETALTMDPHNSQALSDLSWLYVLRGDRDLGVEGLKKAISIKNTAQMNAKIYWRIGYAYWKFPENEEEKESCYEYFVKAVEASTKYAPAYTYLGLFYDELVGDKERAHRCFYTASELDSGELIAGEKLANDFADNNQWDSVEAVASTVLTSSQVKSKTNLDWPYRALGIARLNQSQYADAVKYFQKCLRSAKQDILAWIGLGEAYIYSGRYRSAEKASTRALKLSPDNFSAWYVLSLAQREMSQFPESAASSQKAIEYAPQYSSALQWAMADNSSRAASYLKSQSLIVDALKESCTACEAVLTAFRPDIDANTIEVKEQSVFFGTAAEICLQLDELGYHRFADLPKDMFDINRLTKSFKDYMLSTFDPVCSMVQVAADFANDYVCRSSNDTKPRRVSAHSIAALSLQKCGDLNAATEHYKSAIQLEPRNEESWNAYGVCLSQRNPEVAQHCFVRSLSSNGRNSDAWLNLAALYLTAKDYELTLEALDRSSSLEPENARTWIAQALAEQASGTRQNDHLYRTLDYAYSSSNNDELASFAFALKEYEMRPENPSPASSGALEKLIALKSNDSSAQSISGLLLERKRLYEASLDHLLPSKAWPHVARLQLAIKDYAGALESCEKADTSDPAAHLSVKLVSGLAHFYLENSDSAITAFTEAMDVAADLHEDVLRSSVEVLCASLDADAQQVAQDQLFESIEEHGATLQVTSLLGALGFINKDEAVMQAAQQESQNSISPELRGEPLAQACHISNSLDPTNKSFQRAVFQWPTDYDLWRRVNRRQALVLAEGQTNNPSQLSRALVEAGGLEDEGTPEEKIRNFQRAVFYEPSNEAAWTALASSLVESS